MICEAPLIETERLTLRSFCSNDLEQLCAIWTTPEVFRFIGGKPLNREDVWRRSLAACGQWPYTGFGYWIVEMKSNRSVVGQAGYANFKREMDPRIDDEPELGYVFHPSVHGRGIAFEACTAIVAWGDKNLGSVCYWAIISPENAPSIRLARKLGFERELDASYRGEMIALFRRRT